MDYVQTEPLFDVIRGYARNALSREENLDRAKKALYEILNDPENYEELTYEAVIVSEFNSELLDILVQEFRRIGLWPELRDAFVEFSYEYYKRRHSSSFSVVANCFSSAEDFEWLVNTHPEIFRDEDNQLRYVSADEFWKKRIGRFIATGDVRRIWDEMKKACHGRVVPKTTLPCGEELFCISKRMLTSLTQEAYESMVKRDIFPSWHMKAWKVLKSQKTPGLSEALRYFSYPSWQTTFENVFTSEGGMFLMIAAYVAEKRNKVRKKKNDAAVLRHEQKK